MFFYSCLNILSRPKGISHRRYITRDSVYHKSRKGFISLRVLRKENTLRLSHFPYFFHFITF